MADILHTRDLPATVDPNLEGFNNNIQLDLEKTFNHKLAW